METGHQAHGVLFGGHDHLRLGPERLLQDFIQVLVVEGVVIEEAAVGDEEGAFARQGLLEALRRGDAGEGGDAAAPEVLEGQARRAIALHQLAGAVRARHDLGRRVVAADQGDQRGVGRPGRLGDEDVRGPAEVGDGFAEDAPRQQAAVAEGIVAVDQHQVDLAAERQVLQAVVEQDRVDAEATQRETPAFDAVAVDDDDHAEGGEDAGEHVGLVAGLIGAREHGAAIRDHQRIRAAALRQPAPETLRPRIGGALVAAREDGHLAAAAGEDLGHLQDDGRLSGAADGQVAHHHDLTPQRGVAKEPMTVKPETQAHQRPEKPRKNPQETAQQPSGPALAAAIDHVHGEARDGLAERGKEPTMLRRHGRLDAKLFDTGKHPD